MVPAIRQSIPSVALPSLNLVTLHLDISPRAERSDRELRTLGSGIPVAAAISWSSFWPFVFRYCRIGVACISKSPGEYGGQMPGEICLHPCLHLFLKKSAG
jgi:hypothetical protein